MTINISSLGFILLTILLSFSINIQAQNEKAFEWLTPNAYQNCRYFDCQETLVCQTEDQAEVYYLKSGKSVKTAAHNIQKCIADTEFYLIQKGRNQGIINADFVEVVPPIFSFMMPAQEPGYLLTSKPRIDSSFLINLTASPIQVLGFPGRLISKGKDYVIVGSYGTNISTVYDLKGNKLFDNSEYRLSPIDETTNFMVGEHKENDQQVIFNLDGSIFHHAPKDCFGTFKDLGEVLSIDCYNGSFFVDKNRQDYKGVIKMPDDKNPFKTIHNCNKESESIGIHFDKTEIETDCIYESVTSFDYPGILTAFDDNYKMTLYDFSGELIYEGEKSEVVFPLGYDLFRVVEDARYPDTEGKKYGIRNGKGKTIVPANYSSDSDFSNPCKTFKINDKIYILILQDNDIHIFNAKGKAIVKKSFSNVVNDFTLAFKQINDLIFIKADGKHLLMDLKGNIQLEAEEIKIIAQNSPLCIIKKDGNYQLLDLSTSSSILKGYDKIKLQSKQIIFLEKDGLTRVIKLK